MSRSDTLAPIPVPKQPHTPLTPHFDKQLLAYAVAATAAGVGLAATSEPAHAKIVYTPANTAIPANTLVNLDLNNDGIPDFSLYFVQYGPRRPQPPPLGYHVDNLIIDPTKPANEVWQVTSSKWDACAAALPPAVKVGPDAPFKSNSALLWGSAGSAYSTVLRCKWGKLPQGAFLGLKFVIHGVTHYGWAHVTVRGRTAVLDGYAYETVPNQAIVTGKKSGPIAHTTSDLTPIPVPQPATLGMLAQGSRGLSIWRKPGELEN